MSVNTFVLLTVTFLFLGSKFLKGEVTIPSFHIRQFVSLTIASRYLSDGAKEFVEEDVRLFESTFKIKKT